MLALLFLLFASVYHNSSILPNPTQPGRPPQTFALRILGRTVSPADCLVFNHERTAEDILWSCIAVIFTCTWVSLHLNIPSPNDSSFSRIWRRVGITFYALLAPEAMTTCALMQRRAASRIVREYNKEHCAKELARIPNRTRLEKLANYLKHWFMGPEEDPPRVWTLTHGFFVQMGGFLLYDVDGKPQRVLVFDDIMEAIREGKLYPPTFPDAFIRDKSKSDLLVKLIVVLQTCWFVIQCVARWVQHLTVTSLEVITLAFAVLNIATYVLWWHKPQDVQVALPIFARVKIPPTDGEWPKEFTPNFDNSHIGASSDDTEKQQPRNSFPSQLVHSESVAAPPIDRPELRTTFIETARGVQSTSSSQLSPPSEIPPPLLSAQNPSFVDGLPPPTGHNGTQQKLRNPNRKTSWLASTSENLISISASLFVISIPMLLVLSFMRPLLKTSPFIRQHVHSALLRVPMLYADRWGNTKLVDKGLPFIANGAIVIFGALHLVLWSALFPTNTELLLWRICALVITIIPAVSTFVRPLTLNSRGATFKLYLLKAYLLAAVYMYIIARCVLIILALISVRALPPEAFEDIQWDRFFPHI